MWEAGRTTRATKNKFYQDFYFCFLAREPLLLRYELRGGQGRGLSFATYPLTEPHTY